MAKGARALLNVIGVGVFLVILGYALSQSPPQLSSLAPKWFALVCLSVLLVLFVQTAQTLVFSRAERIPTSLLWAAWFATEKAWVNGIAPVKAGTAGAVVLLRVKFGVRWDNYLRFMLMVSGLTVSASIGAVLLILKPDLLWMMIAGSAFIVLYAAVFLFYRLPISSLSIVIIAAAMQLTGLTIGLGACLLGLGYASDWDMVLTVGSALNLLSVVSITPGNFGVRELALALLSQLTEIPLAEVVNASVCLVFIRLIMSLAVASLLRSMAIGPDAESGDH